MDTEHTFEHIGGHELIDLVNTEIIKNGQKVDLIKNQESLFFWMLDIGLITNESVLFSQTSEAPLLEEVRAFRQQMRQMLVAITNRQPIPQTTIDSINRLLTHWQGQPRLIKHEGEFIHKMTHQFTNPNQLLAQLGYVAAHFLANVELKYVKRCNNSECIRYFLDTSRNHSRRWCSMQGCGNRHKARVHYARKTDNAI